MNRRRITKNISLWFLLSLNFSFFIAKVDAFSSNHSHKKHSLKKIRKIFISGGSTQKFLPRESWLSQDAHLPYISSKFCYSSLSHSQSSLKTFSLSLEFQEFQNAEITLECTNISYIPMNLEANFNFSKSYLILPLLLEEDIFLRPMRKKGSLHTLSHKKEAPFSHMKYGLLLEGTYNKTNHLSTGADPSYGLKGESLTLIAQAVWKLGRIFGIYGGTGIGDILGMKSSSFKILFPNELGLTSLQVRYSNVLYVPFELGINLDFPKTDLSLQTFVGYNIILTGHATLSRASQLGSLSPRAGHVQPSHAFLVGVRPFLRLKERFGIGIVASFARGNLVTRFEQQTVKGTKSRITFPSHSIEKNYTQFSIGLSLLAYL